MFLLWQLLYTSSDFLIRLEHLYDLDQRSEPITTSPCSAPRSAPIIDPISKIFYSR